MKKFFPIITGVIVGIAITASLIAFAPAHTVHGGDGDDENGSLWNRFLSAADTSDFSWNSVFNPRSRGKNIYVLAYHKFNREGQHAALQEIAKSYGMTTDEAQAVLDGSLAPLFHNPRVGGRDLSHDEVLRIHEVFVEDYNRLYEIYSLEQEIDLFVSPSEIFANGDVSDSGFDLVHDLSVIEEILFLEKSPDRIGGAFPGALDSPYDPAAPVSSIEQFIPDVPITPAVRPSLVVDEVDPDDVDPDEVDPDEVDPDDVDPDERLPTGRYFIGDEEKTVEILEEDVCEEPDTMRDALRDIKDEEPYPAEDVEDEEDLDDLDVEDDEDLDVDDEDLDVDDDREVDEEVTETAMDPDFGSPVGNVPGVSNLQPAPAADWQPVWCFGEGENGCRPEFSGMRSLGGFQSSYLKGDPLANGQPMDMGASLCLDITLTKETLSSYEADASCVACEIEQIHEHLDETLGHSLLPNKATGNFMESAKCKNLGALLSMNFITVYSPVPSSEHSDAIYGKNIYEEWDKFVEQYQPIAFSKIDARSEDRQDLSGDHLLDVKSPSAPGDVTHVELLDRVEGVRRSAASEAELAVKGIEQSGDLTNVAAPTRRVVDEMREMNRFFLNFLNIYKELNEDVLPDIMQKETK